MTRAQPRSTATTIKTMTRKQLERAQELCHQLPLIQHELFTLGLVVTSAHMSRTIEKLGYEVALACQLAAHVTPGQKRYEKHLRETGRGGEIKKMREKAIRQAEKMVYGRAA